jgi:hypothetical protein
MKHGLLLFQFGYHLPSPFDSELIADRTSDLAKSFNRLVDRRALVTHGKLPGKAGAQNSLSPAVPGKRTSNFIIMGHGHPNSQSIHEQDYISVAVMDNPPAAGRRDAGRAHALEMVYFRSRP